MSRQGPVVPIRLEYTLQAPSDGRLLGNPFMRVPGSLHSQGSIAGAARELGWSYRHLWGYLKAREAELGRPLILWDKGRAARLSEFAEKLLWAETRIMGRLAAPIENLATEISRELSLAFDDGVPIAGCAASHDLALPELRRLCGDAGLMLDIRFEDSVAALQSLRRGQCRFAGIHLPLGVPGLGGRGSAIHRAFGSRLRPGREKLIRVCSREQGLMLSPGNPLAVTGLADLARLRFVNRSPGTGTRVLLDDLLAQSGVAPARISGYEEVEANHLSVAIAVATGAADAGFGLRAAAALRGLDFIPIVSEAYFLVCDRAVLDSTPGERLRAVLGSEAWREALAALPGYNADEAGSVVSLRRTLPWLS